MATAIEYGLLAALVAVAGITGIQAVHKNVPAAVNVECSATNITESGTLRVDCPGHEHATALVYVNDMRLALSQALRPRPMTCTLYTSRTPECTPQP